MLNINLKHFPALLALVFSAQAFAATTLTDDFTQAAVNDSTTAYAASPSTGNGLNWVPQGMACLTAGIATNNQTTTVGAANYSNIPGCNVTHTVPSADAAGSGALRLTSGVNSTGSTSAGNQTGAIVSGSTFSSDQGLQVTFTTYSYAGDGGGNGHDGADGMVFFLQDGAVGTTVGGVTNIGAFGGSLGYSCSAGKGAGLTGAYLGLGMDEYGNFLNSGDNSNTGIASQTSGTQGGNTFGSGQVQSNRIGLRGAGNVSWYWLNANYPNLYSGAANNTAVENTCSAGLIQNGSSGTKTYSTTALSSSANVLTITVGSTLNLRVGDTVNITASGSAPTVGGTSIVGSYVVTGVNLGANQFTIAFPTGATANPSNGRITIKVMDYPAIPNGYYVLPGSSLIANESATTRANAWPITYRLIITPGGLLSFMYSYNGGAYQTVLTNFNIIDPAYSGALPDTLRFGFTGSTGGSNNVHEISCFRAEPIQSASSAGANTIQAGQVRTGTQVYLASYNPNGWFGALVSEAIVNTAGVLTVASVADWDASCVLTGGACPNTGVAIATPEAATHSTTSRQLFTWNGSAGVPLEWANLTTTATTGQQAILNSSDANGQIRLNWLRGDRSQEQTAAGPLRTRGGVLGDIVDSSPTWVGPPSKGYLSPFSDSLFGSAAPTPPENVTGAQTYAAYASSMATRMNVVYAGSNDGMLHGFRAGHNNADGSYNEQTGNPDGIANDGLNDGNELIGYMPSTVLSNVDVVGMTNPTYGHNYFVDASPGTGDLFYNNAWHSWLVGGMGPGGAEIFALDVTDPTGLVTSTSAFTETNASNLVVGDWTPASLTALTCVHAAVNCGSNLHNTYGTPLVRRLHNGQWAIIFGNGLPVTINNLVWSGSVLTVTTSSNHGYAVGNLVTFGGNVTDSNSITFNGSRTITSVPSPTTFTVGFASNPGAFSNISSGTTALASNSTAGVFIGLVNASTGAVGTFYWLDTGAGSSSSPDGIAYVSSADLDGDHATDYLYAGDLLGNLWRFDLTSSNPADWGVSKFGQASATPLFTATSSGGTVQPITTKIAVTATIAGGQQRVILGFGTGQAEPFTNLSGLTYTSGQQTVYGIWDWDMGLWNAGTTTANGVTIPVSTVQYAALPEIRSTGPTVYQTASMTRTNLLANTDTQTATTRTMAISTVNWCGSSTCSSPNNQYGWYFDLPDTISSTSCGGSTCYEQVIYSPIFSAGELLLNSTIAATSTIAQCTPTLPTGWTMAFNMASGGGTPQNIFPDATGSLTVLSGSNSIVGVKQNSVGTPYVVSIGSKQYVIDPNANGSTANINQFNGQGGVTVKRITWGELR